MKIIKLARKENFQEFLQESTERADSIAQSIQENSGRNVSDYEKNKMINLYCLRELVMELGLKSSNLGYHLKGIDELVKAVSKEVTPDCSQEMSYNINELLESMQSAKKELDILLSFSKESSNFALKVH